MKTLKERHAEWVAFAKAKGLKLLKFNCPHCGKEIETLAAPEGEVFDTAAGCIHCDKGYWREVTNTEVKTYK